MKSARLLYTKFFVIVLLGASLYTMSQSSPNQLSKFGKNLWGQAFLISSFNNLKLAIGDRVFPQVLIGKDGWREYTGENSLDYYQNTVPVPTQKLQSLQSKIQTLYDNLNKENITLILMIPPNKAAIYPDKLPDEFQRSNLPSNLDAFSNYLKQHGPPVLVDLTSALQNERKQNNQNLYYKTDTHWNAYGAFIAYTALMDKLSKTYPELKAKNIDSFRLTTSQPEMHDLARIVNATSVLEAGMKLKPKKGDIDTNKNSLTLLMFRDSFGEGMQDFISPYFNKTTFISNISKRANQISMKTINNMKPNVIIIEFVERYFNENLLDSFLSHLLAKQN